MIPEILWMISGWAIGHIIDGMMDFEAPAPVGGGGGGGQNDNPAPYSHHKV
jgi:hypothetical protein